MIFEGIYLLFLEGWGRKEAPPKRMGRTSEKGQEEDRESVVPRQRREPPCPRAVNSGITGCDDKQNESLEEYINY